MKEIIATQNAPQAIGPYSQAVGSGFLVFTSGQLPLDPVTGKIEADTIEGQTRQSLKNIRQILEHSGSDMDSVIKTTVFLDDMGDFAKMNAVYGEFFTEGNYPARSAVEVAALPMGAKVEIEAVAERKQTPCSR